MALYYFYQLINLTLNNMMGELSRIFIFSFGIFYHLSSLLCCEVTDQSALWRAFLESMLKLISIKQITAGASG